MLICNPIQEKTQRVTLKKLNALKGKADLAEIWLDHIEDLDIQTLLKNKPLPVLCVCKKSAEKGRFKGSYAELAEVLSKAAQCGADYIDIPLQGFRIQDSGFSRLLAGSKKAEVIISHHDFKKTPPLKTLLKKAHEMSKMGADIVKIATMARSLEDTFTIIFLAQLLQAEKIPHILIAMGKKGILSRVLTPFLGGTIMFAPLTSKKATASGQLTVEELEKAWNLIQN